MRFSVSHTYTIHTHDDDVNLIPYQRGERQMRIDSIKFDRDEYDCFERIKIGSENRPMAPGPETQLECILRRL